MPSLPQTPDICSPPQAVLPATVRELGPSPRPSRRQLPAATLLPLLSLLFVACTSTPPSDPASGPPTRDTQGLSASEQSVGNRAPAPGTSTTPAYAADEPVSWAQLSPLLAEASGRAILEEIALDRIIARELSARNLTISPDDVAAERTRLADALADEGVLTPTAANDTIESLRRARGLGPLRYQALLTRNAALRRLVGPPPEPTPDDITAHLNARFGEKILARILVLPSEREAADVRAQLAKDPAALTPTFARLATQRSIDASAPSGGLLRPFSLAEPTIPVSLRQVLAKLKDNELSPVVAIDGGYALALIESRTPATTPTDEDRARAATRVRAATQRRAMDSLAEELLKRAKVTPMDAGLSWSWEGR